VDLITNENISVKTFLGDDDGKIKKRKESMNIIKENIKNKLIKLDFVKELNKGDVKRVDKFIYKNNEEFENDFLHVWTTSSFEKKQIIMYQIINDESSLDNKVKNKAKEYLNLKKIEKAI